MCQRYVDNRKHTPGRRYLSRWSNHDLAGNQGQPRSDVSEGPHLFGLTETELSFLAQRAVPRHSSAGQTVFSESEPCSEHCAALYVVESGHIRIFKSSASGRSRKRSSTSGDLRGEPSFKSYRQSWTAHEASYPFGLRCHIGRPELHLWISFWKSRTCGFPTPAPARSSVEDCRSSALCLCIFSRTRPLFSTATNSGCWICVNPPHSGHFTKSSFIMAVLQGVLLHCLPAN